jgi:hypothetical protein
MNARKLAALLMTTGGLALLTSTSVHADNATITVNATVTGVCKFFASSPVINLQNTGTGSNIDPSSTTPATGSVAVTYRCSNGTTPAFVVPATATVTCGACTGTPTMAPTMTYTSGGAGTGMGSGKDKTLTVNGQITQANFENAVAGIYTGTMVVNVTP